MEFSVPNEILTKNTFKTTNSRVNFDKVPEFSNKVKYESGITIYTLEDTQEGQQAVRWIIDTHWGEDANTWCLTVSSEGNLLDSAWDYWNSYNKTPKCIALKNGKLLAFCVSNT